VFKEVVYQKGGATPKGNCDTDLIMQAMEDFYENKLKRAVLVSSDGDYAPLIVKFLKHDKNITVISPAPEKRCSILLKRTNAKIVYLNDKRNVLERRKR
jgi:uncharacterized LabA/DUF88 family protein